MDFANLSRPEFWQTLLPEFTVTESIPLAERSTFGSTNELREEDWSDCLQTLNREGYFGYYRWFNATWMDRLALAFFSWSSNRYQRFSRLSSMNSGICYCNWIPCWLKSTINMNFPPLSGPGWYVSTTRVPFLRIGINFETRESIMRNTSIT